ncbi:MAG: Addiction module toxin, RelE/StbE family [Candidatus Nomurabacteria bacterium GW2011_GWB1_37_5]|uniref:Addiction module toxin, RelE/StbE family n=1 Tax=Candidatus Nomurabacteria bacterium GW2011_GWB1_37_5 TaxID=1618742 RepID=A0A0G0H0Q5_9BACT|nr:MAG: Addiction module toxin, RelE/StbE family [Candidatus Nomurabacteria bacterium GW2011_GWB1_37_5]
MTDLNKKLKISFSFNFENILHKISKKDKSTFKEIEKQILKIFNNPLIGKPLRNVLKNYRRVHIDSFVLLYRINEEEIIFVDYDHHDKIYKKY